MKRIIFFTIALALGLTACSGKGKEEPFVPGPGGDSTKVIEVKDCKKCMVLSEQSQHRIAIADVESQQIIWEWKPEQSNVKKEHYNWFTNPSDAKPVYEGKYILATASGGGVALIRIADKKTIFYAFAGGNTHSAELLPDGNIVSASSTGNFLTVFKTDSTIAAEQAYSKNVTASFGHNVVWDAKRNLLWTAAMDKLVAFTYNNNCDAPAISAVDTFNLPGTEAHDLFPIYGTDSLWLTNKTNVYKLDMTTKSWVQADAIQKNIKSVSDGPAGFPVIIIRPKEEWWTDEVLDAQGKSIFKQNGLRIYKARWLLDNMFSYPEAHPLKTCP
jgi:hypothetical protein